MQKCTSVSEGGDDKLSMRIDNDVIRDLGGVGGNSQDVEVLDSQVKGAVVSLDNTLVSVNDTATKLFLISFSQSIASLLKGGDGNVRVLLSPGECVAIACFG